MAVTGLCLQSPGCRRSGSSWTGTSSDGGGNRTWNADALQSSRQHPLVQTEPRAQTSGSSGPGAGKLLSTGSGQMVRRMQEAACCPLSAGASQTPAVSLWTPLSGWRSAPQISASWPLGQDPHAPLRESLQPPVHLARALSETTVAGKETETFCHETSCSKTLKIED